VDEDDLVAALAECGRELFGDIGEPAGLVVRDRLRRREQDFHVVQ